MLIKTKDADARQAGRWSWCGRRPAANPTKDDERRELANVLAAASEFKAAADILRRLGKTVADTVKLADLYAGARQWDLAQAELNR